MRQIGGAPVKPYQPEGVWEEATFGNKRYEPDSGEKLYRRSVYTFWRRIVGPTMFFDSAARQVCTVKQARTNTPLHSLATLNDAVLVRQCEHLATNVEREVGTPEEQVVALFRTVLGREPTGAERSALTAYAGQHGLANAARVLLNTKEFIVNH